MIQTGGMTLGNELLGGRGSSRSREFETILGRRH